MKGLNKKANERRIGVSVRLDKDLQEDIKAVKEKASSLGYRFDVSEICRAALRRAVRDAERQLAAAEGSAWSARDRQLDLDGPDPKA